MCCALKCPSSFKMSRMRGMTLAICDVMWSHVKRVCLFVHNMYSKCSQRSRTHGWRVMIYLWITFTCSSPTLSLSHSLCLCVKRAALLCSGKFIFIFSPLLLAAIPIVDFPPYNDSDRASCKSHSAIVRMLFLNHSAFNFGARAGARFRPHMIGQMIWQTSL